MNNSLGNHDCPPKMSDGRHFTDYRPSGYVHDLIIKQNGITNSFDLKTLMINRALDLQKINKDYYDTKNACNSCGEYYIPDPNGHVDYWNRYGQSIGYQSPLTNGQQIRVKLPNIADCPISNQVLPGQFNNQQQMAPSMPFPTQLQKPNIQINMSETQPTQTQQYVQPKPAQNLYAVRPMQYKLVPTTTH